MDCYMDKACISQQLKKVRKKLDNLRGDSYQGMASASGQMVTYTKDHGKMGGWEDGRMGGWEDGRMGSWEARQCDVTQVS
jgi:hypothetical protein